ncbi:MAG: AGE family epimerase/isomerase [Phycisphaerae bacterium]|nr:AGE family epimerase/isomerase [Phycisphaerae bacterium]
MNKRCAELETLYHDALLKDVIPFWEKHSIDRECGGYFTCLDRAGAVFDTDKFMWLQARQIWMFSFLYNHLERRGDWLETARHGAAFLKQHGMDADGNWYFSLTREGRPLVQPYNIFSDCFAAMGFGAYALAAGDDEARDIAVRTFRNILRRRNYPKGQYTKAFPGTRPLRALAMPMILVNLSLELDGVLDAAELDATMDAAITDILTLFHDKKHNLFYEQVAPDGSRPDCFETRLRLPGHGIEVAAFLMGAARRRNDSVLINTATEIMLSLLEYGWDREHGGIFYYLDADGKPPQQLEWDRKMWWVHIESLVALSLAYLLTGRDDCWKWYERVHEYTWPRFADPEFGEWFGYLDRAGKPFLTLKGGKWKGCFHVPRGLYCCYEAFRRMAKE